MNEIQQAFDTIIGPIEEQMVRSIWRIVRDQQDAEDALQNALTTIWRRWDRVCQHPECQALILKICSDAAYDQMRQRYRHQRQLKALLQEPEDKLRTPLHALRTSELYHDVMVAVLGLPRQQAIAIFMRVLQEQSYRSIALALGCSEVTARKHVARGRERLRTVLARFQQTAGERASS